MERNGFPFLLERMIFQMERGIFWDSYSSLKLLTLKLRSLLINFTTEGKLRKYC